MRILDATARPATDWVVQQARNLVMDPEDAAVSAKFLIHDRDASFSSVFGQVRADVGIEVIRSACRRSRNSALATIT